MLRGRVGTWIDINRGDWEGSILLSRANGTMLRITDHYQLTELDDRAVIEVSEAGDRHSGVRFVDQILLEADATA